ncbi:MAG: hypothetical protein M3121_06360, partial [Chloroflexota bacterium]|nr:hypothetical protein [Chloroflexota bacterium]
LGGLLTSTLLSLFLLPALYLRFGADAQPEPVAAPRTPPVAAEPTDRDREVAAERGRSRRFGRAPERRADVAHREGGEGTSSGRRGE